MQRQLELIYEIDVAHNVDDYLITDASLAARMDRSENSRTVKEKLLVSEGEDYLELTLYIDASVMAHLADDNPLVKLHQGNMADFCLAVEGVSHFLYVAWNAYFDKQLTVMELEMQAEVDKYVTSLSLLMQRHHRCLLSPRLRRFLFANPTFDAELKGNALLCYQDANRFAGRYCELLEQQFIRHNKDDSLLSELRRFYRLPESEKIRRIGYA